MNATTGAELRELRRQARLTQRQVANLLGQWGPWLSEIERGVRHLVPAEDRALRALYRAVIAWRQAAER
jgi:transcriptional regulator with XRE-family HTH domain